MTNGANPNRISASDWVQILTTLAVLAGLGLVIWELQQNRSVAVGQMTSDGFAAASQHVASPQGEDSARVLAKACESPEALSADELAVLDAHYRGTILLIYRAYFIEQQTGLYEGQWRAAGQTYFRDIMFRSDAGRQWWIQERENFVADIQDLGNALLADAADSGECFLTRLQKRISTSSLGGDG